MSDTNNRPTTETKPERACVCMFCGAAFWYAGTTPDEATVRAACEHEAQCERNPYLLRIAKLERERDEAREDRDVLAKQVDAIAATIESAQSEASRQSDRADKAEAELAAEREAREQAERHLDMTSDLLRQAMAYCPDRGELHGSAIPHALWSACEIATKENDHA